MTLPEASVAWDWEHGPTGRLLKIAYTAVRREFPDLPIGYSFEHDLHLGMKRVWALVASWGDSAWHRERVARAILDRTT